MSHTHEREELPDLPAAAASFRYVTACERQLVFPGGYRDELGDEFYTADQMRAYGRLCRAGREDAAINLLVEACATVEAATLEDGISEKRRNYRRDLHQRITYFLRRLSPQAGGSDE